MSIEKEFLEKKIGRRDFLRLASLSAGAFVVKDKNDKKEFARFSKDESPEIIDIEERESLIRTDNTPVIFIPLRKDFFFDDANGLRNIEEWRLSNIDLGFKEIITFRESDDTELKITPLPHLTGLKTLPFALVEENRNNSLFGIYWPSRSYGELLSDKNVLGECGLVGDYYPNKIQNLLEASAQVLDYQLKHGAFLSGKTYSMLDLVNIRGSANYRRGKENYLGYSLRGDGVCGIATTVAHALSQMPVRFEEHHEHGYFTRYWVGPLDSEMSLFNDTSISEGGNGRFDFKWTLLNKNPQYISVGSFLTPTDGPTRDGVGEPNARVGLQFIVMSEKPNLEEQLERIRGLQSAYDDYNHSKGVSLLLKESYLVKTYEWGAGSRPERLARTFYIEEPKQGFEEELETDPFLQDISRLGEMVNNYIEEYPANEYVPGETVRLGDYLKKSGWYANLEQDKKDRLHLALKNLNYVSYKYGVGEKEATQCISWVILLANLDYQESPIDIYSHSAQFARQLIPEPLLKDKWRDEYRVGRYHFYVPKSLAEFETGDLFVTYEIPFESTTGHVGAVIAKKEINGETVLLASDANRKFDGTVRMFRVDNHNDYAIFGRPPKRWVAIRKD